MNPPPTAPPPASVTDVPGLTWMGNGQSVLTGPLLALTDRLDRRFLDLAARWDAVEFRFPTFLPATELERIDWFRAFPQLATFPATLDADESNLDQFTAAQPVSEDGRVQPTALAPIRDVLTPAACYHLYAQHGGGALRRAALLHRALHVLPPGDALRPPRAPVELHHSGDRLHGHGRGDPGVPRGGDG